MMSAVAVVLIVLHTVDGHEVLVNPKQITSMHASKPDKDNKFYAPDVHCVVGLTDGKFVSTAESCEVVKSLIEESKP